MVKTVKHNSTWRLTIPKGEHKSAVGLDKIPKNVFDNLLRLLEDGIDETQTNVYHNKFSGRFMAYIEKSDHNLMQIGLYYKSERLKRPPDRQ